MEGILYPTLVMGGLGVIFGALLAFASEKFYVAVDERQSKIREILPGANCGGCGYPGCDGYAEACVSGAAQPNKCAAGGPDVAAKIAEILGVTAEAAEPMVAFVKCHGTYDKTVKDCVYMGFDDCRSAAVVPGKGPASCTYGCLGFGTCVKVCQFDAIHVKDGVAVVDREKCVGCGVCVTKCPTRALTRSKKKYYKLAIMGRTGKKNPRLGKDFLVWADADNIVKIILNTYRFVKEYISPDAPGGKEHIGYIIDRVGFEEYKKWALEGVELMPETLINDCIYWDGLHFDNKGK